MHDHASRLVGLEGFVVTGIDEVGEQLDLQVELLARVAACPRCRATDLRVKDRPLVAVRDLPLAGRVARLMWRKRRYACRGCGRSFTETHADVPARQRVTARFRRRLGERVVGGGAHAEVARDETHQPLSGRARVR